MCKYADMQDMQICRYADMQMKIFAYLHIWNLHICKVITQS
jgi:hypothetical protein